MQHLLSELGYIGLEVSDLARWQLFANDVLGLAVTPGPLPKTSWLRMDEYRYRFILREGPADDCIFVGWKTANPAAVEAFGEHLKSHGVAWQWGTPEELKLRSVQRMLHFQDPAGNRHEVYCGPALATDRFVSPKIPGGFVTRGEGLGHVVYSSSAYGDTLEFASRVLGFGPSDQIRLDLAPGVSFEVSFLHTNARHHSFALAPQPPGPGPHKRIHHFMIEVTRVEDVGFARDRCLAMGQAVHMDIGQHPNDRMISFYGQTPSGFYVEFGWGGVKVDANWHVGTYDRLSEWGHRPSLENAAKALSVKPSSAAPIESPSGSWKVVIKTPMGNNDVTFSLRVDGDQLLGSIDGARESNEIRDGKIDGNSLSWRSKVSSPIPMDLEFTAAIDGDKISGGAKSPFGTAPFSGARA